MSESEDKTRRLGSAPVGRLFFRLALPAVLAQLVTMANNVVDRVWVGHISGSGMHSLEAVGLSLPIQYLFVAFIMMIGAGMGPNVSILLGKGRRDEAGRVSGACFGLALAINAAVVAVIALFADGLLLTFGAGDASLPFARSYLRTIGWGLPFSNMLLLLMMWLNAQGYVADGVRLSLISVVINAALDPLFIFVCGLGVGGAALATNVGAIVALVIGVRKACRDGRLVRFGFADLVPRAGLWMPSVLLGLATGMNTGLESFSLMLVNNSLQRYGGDVAVAALSLFAVLSLVLVSLDLGLSMGAQPIVSYNYGSGRLDRVRTANRYFIGTSFACSFALWAVVMVDPAAVWRCFTSDGGLIGYAADKSRMYFSMLLLTGIQYAHLYIARFLGKVKISIFLGVLKRLILLLPLIFVLPAVLPGDKATSVLMAAPVTDAAAFLLTAVCYFFMMRGVFAKGVK